MKYKNDLKMMDPVEIYKLRLNGTISRFPKGFFKKGNSLNTDSCANLIRYLIEEKLNWTYEDVCNKLSINTFYENELGSMLKILYNESPYRAIENAYPGQYKPWQFKSVPRNYWNKKTSKEATKWLIEEKLKWYDKKICKKISKNTFYENGLGSMLRILYNDNIYKAIENAYPGQYKPWQFKSVPQNYWNKETAKEATKWLIEEKLKWNDSDVCKNLSKKIFHMNGLGSMLTIVFESSPYRAIENTYPGKYRPWQLGYSMTNYWNKETAKEATKWLFEEKLKWDYQQIVKNISCKLFIDNGLNGMVVSVFNGSIYRTIENAYPGKFAKVGRRIKIVD